MWFKNLQLYRLNLLSVGALTEQLARGQFITCGANQATSRGWVAPRNDGALVYTQGQQWLIALKTEFRLLPTDVVAKEVAARAYVIEDQQGYVPGRKQLREIKELAIQELMPRAFTRSRITYAWIDPVNGWLAIDASTPTLAEELIEHLRNCLDEFPLGLLHTNLSPQSAMADWLAGEEAPTGFTIDRDVELKACGEEKAKVTFAQHPLADEWAAEIKSHLAAGKLPTRLALTWDERISFVLTEKLEVKRLAFLDLLKAQAQGEHEEEQFDADFALMTGELQRFIPQLVEALGGEVEAFDA